MFSGGMGTRSFGKYTAGGLVVGGVSGLFSGGITLLLLLVALVAFIKVRRSGEPVDEDALAAEGFMERLYWRTRYLGIFCGLVIGLLISNGDSLKKPKSAVLPTDAAEVESGGAELAVETQPAPAANLRRLSSLGEPRVRTLVDPVYGGLS